MGFLDSIFGAKTPERQTTPDFSHYRADVEVDPSSGDLFFNPDPSYPDRMASRVDRSISTENALGLPAVWRAVGVLTTAVSQLELEVRRNGEKIDTPNLIAKPDSDDTLSEFLEDTVTSLALHGNCYWKLTRGADDISVINIQVLNPLQVQVVYDSRGVKRFSYTINNRRVEFTSADVTHIRFRKVPGHVYGLGPIQTCRSALVGAQDLTRYKDEWFVNSSIPNGILTTQDALEIEDAKQLKEDWRVSQSDHGIAVVGNGLHYESLILNPKDAQFLESQQFSITDIARIFGIPAGLLLAEVNGNSMTYTNQEQSTLEFVRFTLMEYLKKIEDALSEVLVRGQTVHFNLDGLLRPDSKTRAEVQAIYISNKIKTVDEVRVEEGMSPLTPKQKKELNPTPPVSVPVESVPPALPSTGTDQPKVNA